MSEAPTLARARTMPGPISRSRPVNVDGAEVVAPFVCGVISADIGGVGLLHVCSSTTALASFARTSFAQVSMADL